MNNGEIVCPKCGHSDKIRKLSAIVAEEIHSISGTQFVDSTTVDKQGGVHYHSHPALYSGIQTSGRAEQFLPPSEPRAKSYSALLTGLGVLLFLGGCFTLGAVPLMLPVIGMMSLSDSQNSGKFLTLVVGGSLVVFFLVSAILPWVLGWLIFRAKHSYEKTEQERVMHEQPLWKAAVKKWERLYYCERDDIVFDPETGKSCQREGIGEFIYQPD